MADIYYKDGSSWKVLASNPFAIGTYYESIENISPATIVGGNWLSVATEFLESFNFIDICTGLEQISAEYKFNSDYGLHVTGVVDIIQDNIPFTTDSSRNFTLFKSPYPPTTNLTSQIGRFQYRNSPTISMYYAYLKINTVGEIYTTLSPNTTDYIAQNQPDISICYAIMENLQYTLTTLYAWVRIS